jgi:L-fucose/D-arabinose isomerase
MAKAQKLTAEDRGKSSVVTFGVCAACDPRIDQESRDRTVNIIETIANSLADQVKMPNGQSVNVVWTPVLIDGEKQADVVAQQFQAAGVNAIVCTPDTWAFPQLTLMSLLSHFPADLPVNITCGNSGPKPGVVYAHAVNGALAQAGRLTHLNVGNWADFGMNPEPSGKTIQALVDWCYAALTYAGLKGRRVVVFGHDSMGMETALAHINPTRKTFGLEITRLDMKLLADMLNKGAYDKAECKKLRGWITGHLGERLDLSQENADEKLDQSLAMYLIMRDLMAELNAVGGGFMNQLEWGSEPKGIPLPICDLGESLMNSTFDHNGPKSACPFATEADVQGLLTMLVKTWLSGGNPPLFMDFRKVWEPWEIQDAAKELGIKFSDKDVWAQKGIVDGDNSGSASLNWAGTPGASEAEIMKKVSMPGAELDYFPGGGNSVSFVSPGGIEGIASRLAYSELLGMFSLVWDEAFSVDLPQELAQKVANSSNVTWPHTWVVPKYASMAEYKQYAPANHFHMTWDLDVARLQYWMDMTNVLSVNPWQERPCFIEGTDRPLPLMFLINGGENATKQLRARR